MEIYKTIPRDYFAYKGNLYFYDRTTGRYDEVKRPYTELYLTYYYALTGTEKDVTVSVKMRGSDMA